MKVPGQALFCSVYVFYWDGYLGNDLIMASKQQHGTAAEFILKADIREQWHSAKVKNNDYAVKVQKKMIWLSMLKKMLRKRMYSYLKGNYYIYASKMVKKKRTSF